MVDPKEPFEPAPSQSPLWPPPHIVISGCLGFTLCRWDKELIDPPLINKLKPFIRFEPVCPEMAIGLGVPRRPIRVIIDKNKFRLIQPETGLDLTDQMNSFAQKFIASHQEVDGWILKSRSPSCGFRTTKIFTSAKSTTPLRRGSGLFAQQVKKALPFIPLEDEERLESPELLEKFLIKIFILARFHQAKEKLEVKDLVNFHQQNLELLQIFHQKKVHTLDNIINRPPLNKPWRVWDEYEICLKSLINYPLRRPTIIKILQQLLPRFLPVLSSREKEKLDNLAHLFLKRKIILNPLLRILTQAAQQYNPELLKKHTFFSPYPLHLVTL